MSKNFEIITSIRSDQMLRDSKQNAAYAMTANEPGCQFYLLSLHRDRMVEACKAFGRDCKTIEGTAGLGILERELQTQLSIFGGSYGYGRPIKIHMEFTRQEHLHVTASHVPAVSLAALFPKNLDHIIVHSDEAYRIFISPERTHVSIFTQHKTTNRGHYDQQRALLPPASSINREADVMHEMLLVNNHRCEIMEGTITTPYFYRNGEWVTPSDACGGHLGVTRRLALASGLCTKGSVMVDDVMIGEKVILSNGVRGFGWGRVEELEKLEESLGNHKVEQKVPKEAYLSSYAN